jgi:GNAT superfamily N-acetyltransferase
MIRPIKKEDVSECIEMTLEAFKDIYPDAQFEMIEEEINGAFEEDWWGLPKFFVFEINGMICGMGGYAQSWLDWDTFEMFWLCVRKGYEGQGIGRLLVEHRENEIIKNSAHKKDITIIFSAEKEIIDYHKRHGYQVLLNKAAGKEVIMGKSFLKSC